MDERMTAETDLLPLPWIERYAVVGDIAYPVSSDPDGDYVAHDDHAAAMRAYARANLAELQREVEGLRAEVRTLVRQNGEWQARAERLAEALRSAEALAACCMAIDGYSRRELRDIAEETLPHWQAALNATAAQENDDA